MNDVVQAALAKELADLKPVADAPQSPFGYGTDLWCELDFDPDAQDVEGRSHLALAQAILRRLITPRGSLLDDADYGLDLRTFVNRGVTAEALRTLSGQIRAEVSKDDRVETVTAQVTASDAGKTLRVALAINPVDPQTGPFSLTLSATDREVLLDALQEAR